MASLIIDNWYIIAAIAGASLYVAIRKLPVLLVFLLALVHLLFAVGGLIALLDFNDLPSSDGWTGMFFWGVTAILGFPWSTVWLFVDPGDRLWIGWLFLSANYLILCALTIRALRRRFHEKSKDRPLGPRPHSAA